MRTAAMYDHVLNLCVQWMNEKQQQGMSFGEAFRSAMCCPFGAELLAMDRDLTPKELAEVKEMY